MKNKHILCNRCNILFESQNKYLKHLQFCLDCTFECKDCHKKFISKNALHGHHTKCVMRTKRKSNMINEILTFEFMEKMFIINKNTTLFVANNILKDYDITNGDIIKKAKEYNIKLLTCSESARHSTTREAYIKTCLDNYGTINCLSYGTEAYKKRNKTIKNKYGVDNVFQLNSVKQKSKQSLLSHYGVEYPTYVEHRYKNVGRKSHSHIIVEKWLEEYNINYTSEKILKETKLFNLEINKIYQPRPDIFIENSNIIIEIYGDRWHANPEKYNDSDLIYTWMGEKFAKDIRKNNSIREKHLNDCGFVVIILWCSKIIKNNKTNIKEKLIKEIQKWRKLYELQKLNKLKTKTDTIYL